MPVEICSRRLFLKLCQSILLDPIDNQLSRIENAIQLAYLNHLVDNPPLIGGVERYGQRLIKGVGWATWHGYTLETLAYRGELVRSWMDPENGLRYEELERRWQRIFDVTVNGKKSAQESLDFNQYKMTPSQALQSGKYSGYISTRSFYDIGCEYFMFGATSPDISVREIYFIGVALAVDCPNVDDWKNKLSNWPYKHMGWNLEWIADVPGEVMSLLPPGLSKNSNNWNEGKPGVILVEAENQAFFDYGNQNLPVHV